jgi:hypothetical protein
VRSMCFGPGRALMQPGRHHPTRLCLKGFNATLSRRSFLLHMRLSPRQVEMVLLLFRLLGSGECKLAVPCPAKAGLLNRAPVSPHRRWVGLWARRGGARHAWLLQTGLAPLLAVRVTRNVKQTGKWCEQKCTPSRV